jgi:hypothetical protein
MIAREWWKTTGKLRPLQVERRTNKTMSLSIFILSTLACSTCVCEKPDHGQPKYCNPVIRRSTPDPMIIRVANGSFYL